MFDTHDNQLDSYPPLSALNDFLFCPRRCALHRIEGLWQENVHTTSGSLDHRRVHAEKDADESGFRTARGLRLVSHRLRLVGVADIVEFRSGADGAEVPFPVEYKRGKKRKWNNDEAQLCAQALCLEEMMGVKIPDGAIYHVKSKRRREVAFDASLRWLTETAASRLHEMLASERVPQPVLHPKCKQCSLHEVCMPEVLVAQERYVREAKQLFRA